MRRSILAGLIAAVLGSLLAWADGINIPFSFPASTCTNQFIRSIAASTGIGTCASVNFASDGTGIVPAANGGTGVANSFNTTVTSAVSIGRGQFQGTNTNDAATTGNIGEPISGSLASGSAVSLSNGVAKTIISISLTAGDWEVHGACLITAAGTTTATLNACSVSPTDNTAPSLGVEGYSLSSFSAVTAGIWSIPTGSVRVSLAGTTTYYLIGQLNFGVSTATAYGSISARRLH